jgi:hypothetical protein
MSKTKGDKESKGKKEELVSNNKSAVKLFPLFLSS